MENMENNDALEKLFHKAMISVYEKALKECGYKATYFLRMVNELGGVRAAKRLLSNPNIQYGFEKLWECGRLDLTVEYLVLRPEWKGLFTEEEKNIARNRLKEYGFNQE
ncbi:MAG: hypothetical protein AB1523_11970 [Bacillota bacterium]